MTGNLARVIDSSAPVELFDGHGRGWTRDRAVVSTIAEALERYAAGLGGVGAPLRFGSADDLAELAVPPERFTRMTPSEHARHGIGPPLADGASRIGWYAAHDLTNDRPALVPAQLVFMGHNLWEIEDQVQFASSKGLGAHWSDVDAILHALCELVEADAFMIAYLNRLPVPEIDLGSITEAPVREVVAAAGTGGIEFVRAWDLTTDCRMPTVLAALGGSLHGGRVITFGSATAADPVTAATKAIQEAVHTTVWMDEASVTRARSWGFAEMRGVRGRGELKLLGANHAYIQDLEWLLAPRDVVPIDDLPRLPEGSPEQHLRAAIDRARDAGLTCYASDLTPPDVAEATGMRVWRVISPEAQPFTLAPVRYLDSRRLADVPVTLGYRSEPLRASDFNEIPHPCP